MSKHTDLRRAAIDGVCDAAGFLFGALAGWWLGRALGFDFVGTEGLGGRQVVGLLFILAGCGAGRWLAQRAKAALPGGASR
jgi:hypothetical protein